MRLLHALCDDPQSQNFTEAEVQSAAYLIYADAARRRASSHWRDFSYTDSFHDWWTLVMEWRDFQMMDVRIDDNLTEFDQVVYSRDEHLAQTWARVWLLLILRDCKELCIRITGDPA